MIGAIAGDMIGAPYEGFPKKSKDFYPLVSRFTDDTVLTVAVASAILNLGITLTLLKSSPCDTPGPGTGQLKTERIARSSLHYRLASTTRNSYLQH